MTNSSSMQNAWHTWTYKANPPRVHRSSVVRASDRSTEDHRFNSGRGLRFFFFTRARAHVDFIIFHFFTELKIYHHMFTQHFVRSLLATRTREHFKLCTYLLSSYKYLVNLSTTVTVLPVYTAYSLLGKGNYLVNLSLGPLVNSLKLRGDCWEHFHAWTYLYAGWSLA